jgi:glycerol uptake facilitator-like aquaporin
VLSDLVLLIGNLLLFLTTAAATYMLSTSTKSSTNAAFMNAFFGSFMLKFMAVAVGTFIYVYVTEKPNKMAILALFPIYLIYTLIELKSLRATLKQQKNA